MTCPYCLTYLPLNDLCFCAGAVKARRSAFSLPDLPTTSIYPQLILVQKRIAPYPLYLEKDYPMVNPKLRHKHKGNGSSPYLETPLNPEHITIPVTLSLTKDNILEAINEARAEEDLSPIPMDADVFVMVPGGGDWSNEKLSLKDVQLEIRWDKKLNPEHLR